VGKYRLATNKFDISCSGVRVVKQRTGYGGLFGSKDKMGFGSIFT